MADAIYYFNVEILRSIAAASAPFVFRAVSYAALAPGTSRSAARASPKAVQAAAFVTKSLVARSPNAFALVTRPAARQACAAFTSGAGSE